MSPYGGADVCNEIKISLFSSVSNLLFLMSAKRSYLQLLSSGVLTLYFLTNFIMLSHFCAKMAITRWD